MTAAADLLRVPVGTEQRLCNACGARVYIVRTSRTSWALASCDVDGGRHPLPPVGGRGALHDCETRAGGAT